MKKIVLKPGREKSARNRHPWVFSGAIARAEGEPVAGDDVRVVGHGGELLGIGHYYSGTIAVRLYSFTEVTPSLDFWREKFQEAFGVRKVLGLVDAPETTAYRLIHAEGDGFPGLVVDVYGSTCVMQFHTAGMLRIKDILVEALRSVLPRCEAVFARVECADSGSGYMHGKSAGEVLIRENGAEFGVDCEEGQKTGFFLDQRDNRALLARYSSGRRVLNAFSYTGGFSVYALRGGATRCVSVDSSKKAIELCNRNVVRNGLEAHHEGVVADCMDYLKHFPEEFDLVVLDPPAFAKHVRNVTDAAKAYQRINTNAFRQIARNGVLFTFSCSQVVERDLFRKIVFSAAADAGRSVRILHQLTQPADHPISIYHPEGEYLKGLVLSVV